MTSVSSQRPVSAYDRQLTGTEVNCHHKLSNHSSLYRCSPDEPELASFTSVLLLHLFQKQAFPTISGRTYFPSPHQQCRITEGNWSHYESIPAIDFSLSLGLTPWFPDCFRSFESFLVFSFLSLWRPSSSGRCLSSLEQFATPRHVCTVTARFLQLSEDLSLQTQFSLIFCYGGEVTLVIMDTLFVLTYLPERKGYCSIYAGSPMTLPLICYHTYRTTWLY